MNSSRHRSLTLRFLVPTVVFLIVFFWGAAGKLAAQVPASWPSIWHPVTLADHSPVQDPDDILGANSGHFDLYYSDSPHNATLYVAFENGACFFRVQLQTSPGSPNALLNGTWIAQIRNLSTGVIGGVVVDGQHRTVSVVKITSPGAEDVIYKDQGPASPYFDAVAVTPVWPLPTVQIVPNSSSNCFLDFQVPLSALNGGNTMLGISESTPIQLFFGTSQAAQSTGIINKDWMAGGTVDWSIADSTEFADYGASALPVELGSFQAYVKNGGIELSWVTASELNNFGFAVERRIGNGDWTEIGFVSGNGTSNTENRYAFTDVSLPAGTISSSYRLRQMDRDGTVEYSPEVEVQLSELRSAEITDAYPNPFNPSTTVHFTLANSSQVRLTLVSASGQRVRKLIQDNTLHAGSHAVTVESGDLPSGRYLLLLETSGTYSTWPVMVMK